jgi:two-component system, sensor histidine kinase and response regulator
MNDCVTKPVDPDKLKSVLLRWIKIPTDSIQTGINSIKTIKELPQSELPDSIPGIDVTAALKRLMGNRRLFDKLLRDFAESNKDIIENIRQSIEGGDFVSAQSRVHMLKGVAGNLSATEVFAASQELDNIIRLGDKTRMTIALSELEEVLTPLLSRIAGIALEPGLRNNETVAKKSKLNMTDLGVLLQELDEQLKKNNLSAGKVFNSIKENWGSNGWDKQIERLEFCVNQLDFKGAREQLAEVARVLGKELKS